jgi:transposase InsO family protein
VSKRRLVITAVLAGSSQSEVARTYGVSQSWISRLMARYAVEGTAAFEPRSRRPHTSSRATPPDTVELVLQLRKQLSDSGLDAGAETIGWHLTHRHQVTVSRATVHRILTRAGQVTPQPAKRPKASYLGFSAEMPNETWQSDFTHYRLSTGADTEIITWLDDHSRLALHVSAHRRITAPIVVATFRQAADRHGFPASTLTDNGMVYTTRFAGGRNHLEHELRRRNVVQKNSRPNHPTTCGKVERFQQTLKKWLLAQPAQPATIDQPQALLDVFVPTYNHDRPHRALPHRAAPATAYTTPPKAAPGSDRSAATHDRVRTDRIDQTGCVTLRPAGRLHPHRHRPNPRRNPRPAPRPGPARPRHRRRHRRAPPRTDPRPRPGLPAHRPTTRTRESWVRAMPMSCDITCVGPVGIEPTTRGVKGWFSLVFIGVPPAQAGSRSGLSPAH